MKKLLKSVCIGIFFGVSSALALLVLLFILCALMVTEVSVYQIASAVTVLFLLGGYVAGAVLLLRWLIRRVCNTKKTPGETPGQTDCVTKE